VKTTVFSLQNCGARSFVAPPTRSFAPLPLLPTSQMSYVERSGGPVWKTIVRPDGDQLALNSSV